MKRKIFFILSTNEFSGAEKVNFDIIDGLKDKYEFYYVSRRGGINELLKNNHIKWIEIEKLSPKEIRRIVKEYKPDILHATDYKATLMCTLAHVKTPVIGHLHHNAPWIKRININTLSFLFAGIKAKKILTVSKSIQDEYIFSKIIRKKFINVSNPISRTKILNANKNLKLINNKIYDICCVARITQPKNPKRFIDIVSELKKNNDNIKCIWVGDGDLKDKAVEYAKYKHLENNIEFVGYKNNPYEYMSKSKIFLLTSEWEGFGLVAFEALTMGLPCVVSNVGGLPSIIDKTCGMVCGNDQDFIDEINKLLSDSNYYNDKHLKAIEKSKKLDNYEEYCNKLDKVYKEILKG